MVTKFESTNGEGIIYNKYCDGNKCACNSCEHNRTGVCLEACSTCFKRNHTPRETKCFAYKKIRVSDFNEAYVLKKRSTSRVAMRNKRSSVMK